MSNARTLSSIIGKLAAAVSGNAWLPTGAVIDYTANSLPSGFIWADGSILGPATPYQALRNLYINDGFPHGQDGSGNPKVPDHRGRIAAGKDNMGGTAAGRLTTAGSGVNGAILGSVGGAETHTLTTAQMPAHTHANTLSDPGHVHSMQFQLGGTAGGGAVNQAGTFYSAPYTNTAGATTGITINNASQGSGAAHNNTQPTLVLNKIIKT